MNFLIFPIAENSAWVEERRLAVFESLFHALSHIIN